ncbi:glycosyltransferase [Cyanobium gracile]|uniref:Glycosyltransferase n=1 Tax=Cyanobium gracile UHCC 0281 TaxID=3110309 RepID=A0ABU5SXN1_9CYAN|nr:glycosyltransferase [Cyanobium gracile]MEA5443275.1 glycosyltransferase [Cyanobium gracile UHCC 0281]
MKPKIIIVSTDNRSQGIYNDAINLSRALHKCGYEVLLVLDKYSHNKDFTEQSTSVYSLTHYGPYSIDVEPNPKLLSNDLLFSDILEDPCAVIQIESLNLSIAKLALNIGIRYFLLVNLEWCVYPKTTEYDCPSAIGEWISIIREYDVICLARSLCILRRLMSLGIDSIFISWSVPGPIIPSHLFLRHEQLSSLPSFFFSGGNNGWMQRRGADILASALRQLTDSNYQSAKIYFKCNRDEDLEALNLHPSSLIQPMSGFLQRKELVSMYKSCTFFLYPSRFEGLGLSLFEACQYGLIPIYTGGFPMDDVVGLGGIRLPARLASMARLADFYDIEPTDVSSSIKALCDLNPNSLFDLVYEKKKSLCSHMWSCRRTFFSALTSLFD